MNFIKKAVISSLILASTLFSNPGTKISTFGDIGAKLDKTTSDLEEIISLNSNSFAGVFVDCDEVPFFNIKGYYSTTNEENPQIKYNLYDELTDSLTIQGIQLTSDVARKIFESQGYVLENKYFDFSFETRDKYSRNKINFADISWIKEEQENNEELQNILTSIYDEDWDAALIQFITGSITNALDASLGDFEKHTDSKKVQTWIDEKHYAFSVKIPKYNFQTGIKNSVIKTEIAIDEILQNRDEYQKTDWFTNILLDKSFKKTNNSLFLDQHLCYDSNDNLTHKISGEGQIITLPKQRHIISFNGFYDILLDEKYSNATGFSFKIKKTNNQEQYCRTEIDRFNQISQIRTNSFENKELKNNLIEQLNTLSNCEGSSLSATTLYDDILRLILEMSYFGKESGMSVKYDVSKQGGKIKYVFANKGYLGISIYKDITVSAGLKLDF
ncbi:MAG: hypothetical protein PHU51_03045 [Candidatus Nanoarchaeia archaeon]|nr:hypothetical protein [Candidatus Nanoarchaeia archaeon]